MPKPSAGYGGRFGVQMDRKDKVRLIPHSVWYNILFLQFYKLVISHPHWLKNKKFQIFFVYSYQKLILIWFLCMI